MDLRIAAYAVITDEHGRMLLPHLNEPGVGAGWTLPGGGVESGEDPADAVVREVLEETGYRVLRGEILGIDNLVIPAERRKPGHRERSLQNLRIIYRAWVLDGKLRAEQDGSTDDVAWFTPEEVEGLTRMSLVDVGRKLAEII